MPVLAIFGVVVVQRRRRRLAADAGHVRSSRAQKEARKRLQRARKALQDDKAAEFYAEVSAALQRYVGDKLNVSAVGMRHDDFREHLAATGFSEDERERMVQLLEQCDAARFAPGGYTHTRMAEVLREVEQLLATLEEGWNRNKRRNKGGGTGGFPAVLLAVSLAVMMQETLAQAQGTPDFQGPEQVLAKGHAAYEAGHFSEAVMAYLDS